MKKVRARTTPELEIKNGLALLGDPVDPTEILASIYHSFGIDPVTIFHNHLNQPRELVKAQAVPELFV